MPDMIDSLTRKRHDTGMVVETDAQGRVTNVTLPWSMGVTTGVPTDAHEIHLREPVIWKRHGVDYRVTCLSVSASQPQHVYVTALEPIRGAVMRRTFEQVSWMTTPDGLPANLRHHLVSGEG